MKKLILLAMVLVMAGFALAFTVTDNPSGGQYPAHMRRASKGTPVNIIISQVAIEDTAGSANPYLVIDTLSASSRRAIWMAPFDCKVDSFYVSLDGDSLLEADSVYIMAISNNSATNGDTLLRDSLNGVQALYTPILLHGGPGADTTKNKLTKGKHMIISVNPAGSAISSKSVYNINFMVTPADWAR